MTTRYIFPAVLVAAALASCTNEDYKLYDTTQKDSVFFEYRNQKNELKSEFDYTFGFDIAQVHTFELPVTLMGVPKDKDREIKIETAPEETTMVEDTHYTIENNIIPAGAVNGVVKINLLRDKDPELTQKSFTLRIRVAENDDLKSVGDTDFTITYSDIRPNGRPLWWTTYSPMPAYSFESAQLFFEYFHRLAPEANLAFYNEMVEAYGAYFEKATNVKGPLAMYDAFIRNYVALPLFREHPELEWQRDYYGDIITPEW